MAKHSVSLAAVMVLSLILFIITMVFTALASQGTYPFLLDTRNISEEFITEITPSGWTFAIWSIIYAFLASLLVFSLSGVFRQNAFGHVYCSPAVLPHGFFVTLCLNLSLNVAWLFLWDRKYIIVSLVFLVLIALSNYALIFFSCWGLNTYGAWLSKHHPVELWLHRLLVQNGVAVYATWTTVASLVNLSIVLAYRADMSAADAATVSLSALAVLLAVWFVLENWVLDKHVRLVLVVHPAVVWALAGVFTNTYDPDAPSRNNIFVAALLAVSCSLCALRTLLVVWRQIKRPTSADLNPEATCPMEIADKQRRIFK